MEDKKSDTAQSGIEPTQLTGKSRFTFACHKGLSCFTDCCHGMEIILAPYDILRLKKRLGMTSGEFLARHGVDTVHEESGLPLVILKMGRFSGNAPAAHGGAKSVDVGLSNLVWLRLFVDLHQFISRGDDDCRREFRHPKLVFADGGRYADFSG